MKPALEKCSEENASNKIIDDFKEVKKIVEDSIQFGCNENFPPGSHLI